MDAYREHEERGFFDTHIIRHEGSLMIDLGKGNGPEMIQAALLIASQQTEVNGESALIWRVHSSMSLMAAAVARFFVLNPAFYQAVEGNLAMMLTGRMDGGMGDAAEGDCGNPACPIHGRKPTEDPPPPVD